MTDKRIKIIVNILVAFIILQPVFDIISNLSYYNIISLNFVTYLKPLLVFGIYIFLFIFSKFKKKKQFIYYFLIFIFIVGHLYLLYLINTNSTVIIHELRFIINIVYFLTLFLTLKNVYNIIPDKNYFIKKLKIAFLTCLITYVIFYIISLISNSSWLTYEFSDSLKKGYRGWYFNGQIFGHLLCISLPIFIYYIFKLKTHMLLKITILITFSIPFLLLGTKVPYIIMLIVYILYIIVNLFYKYFHREFKINKIEISTSILLVIVSLMLYKYIPVYTNVIINKNMASSPIIKEELPKEPDENENNLKNKLTLDYEKWTIKSLEKLNKLYESGKVHSSNNRGRQFYYMHYKFIYASIPFKLLGIGYINQPESLAIERDIIMPLYAFGIMGFLLFTGIIWLLVFKIIIYFIKYLKKINIETLLLMESIFMFICISFYAGYTYIYTQFALILSLIMLFLFDKLYYLKNNNLTNKLLNNITTKTYDEVLSKLNKNLKNNHPTFVITANPETIMLAKKDKEISDMLNNKENLKVPDGIAIVKACQKNNLPITKRITGCDLCYSLLKLANQNKNTIYLYGAKEEIIEKLKVKITQDYPNIKILNARNGYTSKKEEVKKEIITLKPDICLVALGIPAQEKFINEVIKECHKGIFMGVGGSFDVISGSKKRAPQIFIKLNLEWLYRILKEPKRLIRFLKSNIRFIFDTYL